MFCKCCTCIHLFAIRCKNCKLEFWCKLYIFKNSIIKKLEEHEEFFPAFQAFTNELLEILGKITLGSPWVLSFEMSLCLRSIPIHWVSLFCLECLIANVGKHLCFVVCYLEQLTGRREQGLSAQWVSRKNAIFLRRPRQPLLCYCIVRNLGKFTVELMTPPLLSFFFQDNSYLPCIVFS